MAWRDRAFDELTVHELYAIVALRERVFVVEQSCVYLDADGHDQTARHLWLEDAGEIRCYARIIPPQTGLDGRGLHGPPDAFRIGRVIVAPSARGTGLGRELMTRAIALCGAASIKLGAQAHLEKFYASLGFACISPVYLEDGIPHVDMLRPA